ncbi:MAG: sigma-70 family RNA polymerase sigma factor [Planctomycetaceae bacterium]|nr:sigma-70 family RNA polymerase sigma factor [Planctomycetaceae bacterium]
MPAFIPDNQQAGNSDRERIEVRRLVKQARQGDGDAAATLLRRYEVELRAEIRRRLRNSPLREVLESMDIFQSVFGSFFAGLSRGRFRIDGPNDVIRLLSRMAQNKLNTQYRRELAMRRDRRKTVPLTSEPAADAPPEEQAVHLELLEQVRSKFTEKELEIVDLRIAGESWAVISERLSEPVPTLQKRLARAVNRISSEPGNRSPDELR